MELFELVMDFLFPYDPNMAIDHPSKYDHRPYPSKHFKNYKKTVKDGQVLCHDWDNEQEKEMVSVGQKVVMETGQVNGDQNPDLVKQVMKELLKEMIGSN